jgi:hypothetical protein
MWDFDLEFSLYILTFLGLSTIQVQGILVSRYISYIRQWDWKWWQLRGRRSKDPNMSISNYQQLSKLKWPRVWPTILEHWNHCSHRHIHQHSSKIKRQNSESVHTMHSRNMSGVFPPSWHCHSFSSKFQNHSPPAYRSHPTSPAHTPHSIASSFSPPSDLLVLQSFSRFSSVRGADVFALFCRLLVLVMSFVQVSGARWRSALGMA